MDILKRSFYERPTVRVAQDLLGKIIVRTWQGTTVSGIIIQTEAYCGVDDPASHAYRGQTKRNKAMFGPPGHSYVYFTYGNHYCLNLIAKEKGAQAGGVLLRGLIPHSGIDHIKKLRGTDREVHLLDGPGKIGQAFNLTLAENNIDVTKKGPLYVTEGIDIPSDAIVATPRIGISKAQDKLWRFLVKKELCEQLKKQFIDE